MFLMLFDYYSSYLLKKNIDRYVESESGLINNQQVLDQFKNPGMETFFRSVFQYHYYKFPLYRFLNATYPFSKYRRIVDAGGGSGVMSYLFSLSHDAVHYVEQDEASFNFFKDLGFQGITYARQSVLDHTPLEGDLVFLSEVCYALTDEQLDQLFSQCSNSSADIMIVYSQWFGLFRLLKEKLINSKNKSRYQFGKRRPIGFYTALAKKHSFALNITRRPDNYLVLHFQKR